MGLYQDIALFLGIALIFSGIAFGAGIINLPGTSNIQLPGDGESQEPRYVLQTELDVKGTSISADLDADSFNYDTNKCNVFSCGTLSFTETPGLSLGGADDVSVNIGLFNDQGVKVAEADKFLGSVGWFETNTVNQQFSNIKQGQYSLKYTISQQSAFGDAEWSRSFDVRVPETIAEGGGS